MKKVLKILAILFLSLIILFAIIAGMTYYKSSQYEKTVVPYIKEKIPLLSNWEYETTKSLMSPKVLENTKEEDLKKIIHWFSKLGKLNHIEKPEFRNVSTRSSFTGSGTETIVTYEILAHYENGDATITMSLLDNNSSFKIYHFNINSMALLNEKN
jgi:hypothetical protein